MVPKEIAADKKPAPPPVTVRRRVVPPLAALRIGVVLRLGVAWP
jgi:hypothetical protein